MGQDNNFREGLVAILPQLRRFARTLTRNPNDADDLLQAACERAMSRSDQWQDGTRLDSWMYTMMRNLWISELRKQKTRTGAGVVDAGETDELRSDATPEGAVYGNQLMRMVMALPEGFSSVLLLVSVEGRSYTEAAGILGIPEGTVMSRMSAARQKMRAQLREVSA